MTSLMQLFRLGGPVMVPLLLCSFLVLAVIAERAILWWRIETGRENVVDRVASAAAGATGAEAMRRMRIAAETELRELGRFQDLLNTMVTLAPLLGIFGTVLGIMDSFRLLEPSVEGAAAPAREGLAQALLTTAFGLLIAMLSLVAHRVLQGRVAGVRHRLELALELQSWQSPAPGGVDAEC